jgi:hypothetical protein
MGLESAMQVDPMAFRRVESTGAVTRVRFKVVKTVARVDRIAVRQVRDTRKGRSNRCQAGPRYLQGSIESLSGRSAIPARVDRIAVRQVRDTRAGRSNRCQAGARYPQGSIESLSGRCAIPARVDRIAVRQVRDGGAGLSIGLVMVGVPTVRGDAAPRSPCRWHGAGHRSAIHPRRRNRLDAFSTARYSRRRT